jgi:hypothetical protein
MLSELFELVKLDEDADGDETVLTTVLFVPEVA